jgi:hypothetical protein
MTTNRTKLTQASACLIGGRAKRLLQSHRDRIDDPEDIKMLEALERNPYANLMVNPVFEDVLEELEEMSGMPDIGPDVVDAHAYAKLAEAYEARDEYVGESLSECGLELIDAYAYDEGNRLRIRNRERAQAWFEDEGETARDSDDEDEDEDAS